MASFRRIAQRLHEDFPFRVLAANNTPDFRTISDFRKEHLLALADLSLQVLDLCQRAGLVKLGHVASRAKAERCAPTVSKARTATRRRQREQRAQQCWGKGRIGIIGIGIRGRGPSIEATRA